jgi:hypothetical protein
MNAVDAFGGKKALAAALFDILSKSQIPSMSFFADADPVQAMSKISRSDLLDWMFSEGISLQDVMKPQWNTELRKQWLDEMQRRGVGGMIGSDGSVDGAERTLGLLVSLQALDELCGPPRKLSERDVEKIQALRAKYRRVLAQPT